MFNLKNIKSENSGFTLIEIILAIAISGTVIAMATGMIIQAFEIVGPSSERISAKQSGELNLTEISRFARNASDADIDKNNNNEIVTLNNEIVSYNSTENKIEVEKDGSIVRKFHNINSFTIEKDNESYIIKIEKCENKSCNDPIRLENAITPRG